MQLAGSSRNILILAHKVQARLPDLEKADIQEVLESYVVELTEDDFEQLTAISEADEDDPDSVLEKSQLTTGAAKRRLRMVDDFIHSFFEVNHFVNKCQKFKHEIEAFMALYQIRTCRRQSNEEHLLYCVCCPPVAVHPI